ncbi:unnamed protein product [Bursaphelenchus okinawaensis]|uniref:Uncharacterized protein n=1 Tax=Bursaphelenchus okinawaensis TaxID=465554 RepID=A0A811L2X8_9BILA|nr:unnamed protein product [Bursaphelenchus okinawaensis]CAG9117915.1 unnamed protein product [Bursaphelenchus okinawaensis]
MMTPTVAPIQASEFNVDQVEGMRLKQAASKAMERIAFSNLMMKIEACEEDTGFMLTEVKYNLTYQLQKAEKEKEVQQCQASYASWPTYGHTPSPARYQGVPVDQTVPNTPVRPYQQMAPMTPVRQMLAAAVPPVSQHTPVPQMVPVPYPRMVPVPFSTTEMVPVAYPTAKISPVPHPASCEVPVPNAVSESEIDSKMVQFGLAIVGAAAPPVPPPRSTVLAPLTPRHTVYPTLPAASHTPAGHSTVVTTPSAPVRHILVPQHRMVPSTPSVTVCTSSTKMVDCTTPISTVPTTPLNRMVLRTPNGPVLAAPRKAKSRSPPETPKTRPIKRRASPHENECKRPTKKAKPGQSLITGFFKAQS